MDCFCRERLCAAASTRAAPLASIRPRRAGMARQRVCKHGCGLLTTPRAPDLAVGQSSCASGRTRRARAPGQSMPLSSPSPRGEFLVCVPGFDPCWNVAGSPRGAAPRHTGRTMPHHQLPVGCAVRSCLRTRARVRAPAERTPARSQRQASGRLSCMPRHRA
jgi:hypothetical protein